MRLRPVQEIDRTALLDIWQSAWTPVLPQIDFAGRRAWFDDYLRQLEAAGALTLVATSDGIIGFINFDPQTGYIDQIAVTPTCQGSGAAKALLEYAKQKCPDGLTLKVNQQNPRAIAFYLREGFVMAGAGTSETSGLPLWHMRWPHYGSISSKTANPHEIMLKISEFVQDAAFTPQQGPPISEDPASMPRIDGVTLSALHFKRDRRGTLVELLTFREDKAEAVEHIYQVDAAPGAVRAWVFHKHQSDRLAFTAGDFRIVLYDIRPESPTHGQLNIFDLGAARPARLKIPAYVVHGVHNRGTTSASFVNMPTRAYLPSDPDKWRIAPDHPGVPYRF